MRTVGRRRYTVYVPALRESHGGEALTRKQAVLRNVKMWIVDYLLSGGWLVAFQWKFGGKRTMRNPETLNKAQDDVFANQTYWPEPANDGEITYCNVATLAVVRGVGCRDLDPGLGGDPLTADQLYARIKGSPRFLVKPMADCQELVNAGTLILAILPAEKLGQHHGHVCTLTPGESAFSGHWDAKAPAAMNLGRKGTCFRNKGVNYAFVPMPEFYAWVASL